MSSFPWFSLIGVLLGIGTVVVARSAVMRLVWATAIVVHCVNLGIWVMR